MFNNAKIKELFADIKHASKMRCNLSDLIDNLTARVRKNEEAIVGIKWGAENQKELKKESDKKQTKEEVIKNLNFLLDKAAEE